MSYVEHGPRIFLAGRPSNGLALTYGDYVLPKKRSEGRLKMYESCSDIRAWSPNPLENSRYFRELTEHSSPPGRIVPVNVVIDNIIELNSQTRKELQQARKELQKYKSLKLTREQEDFLQNYDVSATGDHKKVNDSTTEGSGSLSQPNSIDAEKCASTTQSNSYLSIHLRPSENRQDESRTGFDGNTSSTNTDNSAPCREPTDLSPRRNQWQPINDVPQTYPGRKQLPTCVEFADAFSQAEEVRDIRDAEVQTETYAAESTSHTESKSTIHTVTSEVSSLSCQCCTHGSTQTSKDERSSKEDNNDESAFDSSSSQDSFDSENQSDSECGTDSTYDIDKCKRAYKKTIIKKESVIMALMHDLSAKKVEINELRMLSRNIENSMREKERSFKIHLSVLQNKHDKANEEKNCEVANLKHQLFEYTCMVDSLRETLDEEREISVAQQQEIKKLKLCAKSAVTLRAENQSLIIKLDELERQLKEAEGRITMLEELKDVLTEEQDRLQNQIREQNCKLADERDNVKRLSASLREITKEDANRPLVAQNEINDLRAEIQKKDEKIVECEKQLIAMGKEINDLQDKLKNSLIQNLEEFESDYEGLKRYERKEVTLLVETMSNEESLLVETRNQSTSIHERGRTTSDQYFDTESVYKDSEEEPDEKDVITLRAVRKTDSWESEMLGTDRSDINTGERLNEATDVNDDADKESTDLNTWHFAKESYEAMNRKLKKQLSMRHKNAMSEVEKDLVDQTSQYLLTVQSFMQKLQVYIEEERPLMIKQIHDFHEALKDATAQKKMGYDLFNKHLEECNKCKTHRKDSGDDLYDSNCNLEQNEMMFYRKLEEILQQEEMILYDKHVDKILAMHIKSSIEKIHEMSAALQGAGDQHMEIVREIEKQRREIEVRDEEIARLKEQVAERGDGDCPEDREKARLAEEKVKVMEEELRKKNATVQELHERLNDLERDRLACSNVYQKYNALMAEKNDLVEKWNTLLKENDEMKVDLEQRNDEIQTLVNDYNDAQQQLDKMKITVKDLSERELQIKEMKLKLDRLRAENDELQEELLRVEKMRSKGEERILELNGVCERAKNEVSCLRTNYNIAMQKKLTETEALMGENGMLSEKLQRVERKLAEREKEISGFVDEKTEILQNIQQIISKSGVDKKKVELQIDKLKTQITCLSTDNEELRRQLDDYMRTARRLRLEIETWKEKQALLAQQLPFKVADEVTSNNDLKNRLLELPNRIYEKLVSFNKRAPALTSTGSQADQLKQTWDNKNFLRKLDRSEKGCQSGEEQFLKRYEDLMAALDQKDGELKDLREKLSCIGRSLESDTCIDDVTQDEISKDAEVTKDTNDILCNVIPLKHKLKCLQNENSQKQAEIQKLTGDVEARDSEIKSLREKVNCLSRETEDLHRKVKMQTEEYQVKLAALKAKYDSSLNASRKRHDEDVKRLEAAFFDDALKGEWSPFGSEKWLKSLTLKELTELQNRIRALTFSSDDQSNRIEQNLVDKSELFEKINEYEDKFRVMQSDARFKVEKLSSELQHERQKLSKLKLMTEDRTGTLNDINRSYVSGDTGSMHKIAPSRLHSSTTNYKQELGLFDNMQDKVVKDTKFKLINEPVKDDTFEKQRKNFIYQCSMYHRAVNNM